MSEAVPHVPFGEAVRVWTRVAAQSFGGPAGQIAVMHRILVEEKRWISQERFLHALNYCMLLPGPEAQQLATYVGWLLHGYRGGLVAGGLFILPGFLSILALSLLYAVYRDLGVVSGLFFGLKAAVLAVVVEAVLRIGRRVLTNRAMLLLATTSFLAIFVFDVPFPLLITGAALTGVLGARYAPDTFTVLGPAAATASPQARPPLDAPHTRPSLARAARVTLVSLALWSAGVAVLGLAFGWASVYVDEGLFFSKTAVVTFGGAYAVLAYIAQQAVERFAWLEPGEMLDGLGMAESTPGPLIQVVQFVGFMGAYRNPGTLDPLLAGVLGSLVTTWVTFVPCFLFIFVGAPWIEALRGNRALSAALSAITAAVVGVILNLALWFALHVLFERVEERRIGIARLFVPELATLEVFALVLAAGAMLAMLRFRRSMTGTLAVCALLGILWRLAAGA